MTVDSDAFYKLLYAEISFRQATSTEHLSQIKTIKKQKKSNKLNYMNYKDKVFPLDVILDAAYWKQLKTNIKYPISHQFKPGTIQPFLSTSTGIQISGLTWINSIDSVLPYHSGYSNVLWHVSDLLSLKTTPFLVYVVYRLEYHDEC